MKNFKSTWIMFGAVALLAAYTFYEFKHSEEDGDTAHSEKRLFWLLRDDLQEFELTSKGATSVVRKSGDTWMLVKPVEDLAEASAVEGFIFSLLSQKGKQFQSADDIKNGKASDYGLDPVVSKITLKGKGKTETLEISSKNTFDGQYYVRSNGDKELLIGDRALAQLVEREPSSFRSRKIFRESEDVKQIEITIDGEFKDHYALKREGEKWLMTPDPGFPIDSVKTNVWMQKIQGMMPSAIVAETLTDSDRENFLLKKPSMIVRMDGWELNVGQDKAEDVFVTTNKRSTVYKTSVTQIDPVRVPKIYFRDGHLPFKFDVELVREIEIHADTVQLTAVKKDNEWILKTPEKDRELDQDRLINLIQTIHSFEAQEFLTSEAGKGFPSTAQIVLKDTAGKPLYSLAWGGEYKPKFEFNKGYTFRFVRTSNSKEIVGLPKEKLDRLVESGIIKKKSSPENTTAKTEPK